MEAKHRQQLDRCRVPHFTGPFSFEHGHSYYWVVTGPVPLDIAWELYRDPCGPQIRVAGHCGVPEPVDPWVTWRMPDGTQLASLADEKDFDRYKDIMSDDFRREYMLGYTFSDCESKRALAKGYVELYHIDSEVGLRVFVDHLRWNGLLR